MTPGRLVVVRHAHALARSAWTAGDDERPLSPTGERQADDLAGPLAALGPVRALTSPARRCVDTLAPFAARAGLRLEPEPLLGEGGDPGTALARLLDDATRAGSLVCCTHGDVIDGLVALLARRAVALEDASGAAITHLLETPKGGRWELDLGDGAVRRARLVGPPAQLAGPARTPGERPAGASPEPGGVPRG